MSLLWSGYGYIPLPNLWLLPPPEGIPGRSLTEVIGEFTAYAERNDLIESLLSLSNVLCCITTSGT